MYKYFYIFALSEKLNICDLWNTRFNEYNKIFSKQNNKNTNNYFETSSSPLHIVKTYYTKCLAIFQTMAQKWWYKKYPPIVQTIDRNLTKDLTKDSTKYSLVDIKWFNFFYKYLNIYINKYK